MGSSWRENVGLYGLSSFGAGLAARILTLGPEYVITNWRNAPGESPIVRVPLDTEPDVPYSYIPHFTGFQNFPYGIDVEPDVPV